MWVAGLRGAMAYALALDSAAQPGDAGKAGKVILLVTLIYALFTILIISTVLYPIMLKCDVVKSADDSKKEVKSSEEFE